VVRGADDAGGSANKILANCGAEASFHGLV
jgi:hypothetical protein